MSEIYGPQTYQQYLESRFDEINPNCHCTQSNVVRRRGIRLVMDGLFSEDEATTGTAQLLEDCAKSKAIGLCCDVIQKCTKVEFIGTDPLDLRKMVDDAVTTAAANSSNEE